MMKLALAGGHPKYAPIDLAVMSKFSVPHVEPGRIEIRMNDFYGKLAKALQAVNLENLEDSVPGTQSNVASEGWEERYSKGVQNRQHERELWNSVRSNKFTRYVDAAGNTVPTSAAESRIGEDNAGYRLLQGLGWNEGSGLGAEGGGILEPVREVGKKDRNRSGLGNDDSSSNVRSFKKR